MNQKLSDIYLKSLKEPENFWREIANDIFWFKKPTKILNKSKSPFYKWFEAGVTNTCYNALDLHIDNGLGDKIALIYDSPITGAKSKYTYSQLREKVSKFAWTLRNQGINKGDRVAAYLPNLPETVIAYISASTLGAIWSSCSPDFGTAGVIDRFSQISPKILFIGDKYFYNGKKINILERLPEIINKVPSIKKIVVVPYPGTEIEKKNIRIGTYDWNKLIISKKKIKFNM